MKYPLTFPLSLASIAIIGASREPRYIGAGPLEVRAGGHDAVAIVPAAGREGDGA